MSPHPVPPSPPAATVPPDHVVVLIHGIRTQGAWGEMVAAVLEGTGPVRAVPLRYGYFDFLRFVSPFFSRRGPVAKILRELRDIRALHPTAKISVVAHSFGTYVVMKALQEREVILHRVILCGSIIPEKFRRADFRSQLGPDDVLNDCGTHDIWPPLAKSITWGYGATGTFGLGTAGVRDRFNKYGHSDYFNKEFVTDFWAPYIHEGRIVPTAWEVSRQTPPWWQSMLAWFPFKYLILGAILALLWMGWSAINNSGAVSVRLGDDIVIGHYTGVPAYTHRVYLDNTTRREATVTDIRLMLTDPDGHKTAMMMEGLLLLGMGSELPATDQWLLRPKDNTHIDYVFFNASSGFTGLHQEVYNYMTRNNVVASTPDENRELLPAALAQKVKDFAKSQFIWKPGKWTATLTARLGDQKLTSTRTFSLSQDEVDTMFRITEHYRSGIGVFMNWRAVSFGSYKPYLPKTADP